MNKAIYIISLVILLATSSLLLLSKNIPSQVPKIQAGETSKLSLPNNLKF
jgi:hypothetical protein